jgi:hypothetical protein
MLLENVFTSRPTALYSKGSLFYISSLYFSSQIPFLLPSSSQYNSSFPHPSESCISACGTSVYKRPSSRQECRHSYSYTNTQIEREREKREREGDNKV